MSSNEAHPIDVDGCERWEKGCERKEGSHECVLARGRNLHNF